MARVDHLGAVARLVTSTCQVDDGLDSRARDRPPDSRPTDFCSDLCPSVAHVSAVIVTTESELGASILLVNAAAFAADESNGVQQLEGGARQIGEAGGTQ